MEDGARPILKCVVCVDVAEQVIGGFSLCAHHAIWTGHELVNLVTGTKFCLFCKRKEEFLTDLSCDNRPNFSAQYFRVDQPT